MENLELKNDYPFEVTENAGINYSENFEEDLKEQINECYYEMLRDKADINNKIIKAENDKEALERGIVKGDKKLQNGDPLRTKICLKKKSLD